MAPKPPNDKAPPVAWPKIFEKSIVFSLTAANPMGQTAPAEWNRKANEALEADIAKMEGARQLSPRAVWRSFGFNAQDGWREDGFSIAFAMEERVYARSSVLKLAHKYRQAAVYSYTMEDGQLMREVVWVDASKRATLGSKERMGVLTKPAASPLASRDYRAEDPSGDAPKTPQFEPTGRNKSMWISPADIGRELARLFGKE